MRILTALNDSSARHSHGETRCQGFVAVSSAVMVDIDKGNDGQPAVPTEGRLSACISVAAAEGETSCAPCVVIKSLLDRRVDKFTCENGRVHRKERVAAR